MQRLTTRHPSKNVCQKCGEYWECLQEAVNVLYASTAAHRRRHNDIATVDAETVSVKNLHVAATQLLEKALGRPLVRSEVPCVGYVERMFMPSSGCLATSSRFYGRVKIRRVMQSACLRVDHVDGHYVNALWRIVREWLAHLAASAGWEHYWGAPCHISSSRAEHWSTSEI